MGQKVVHVQISVNSSRQKAFRAQFGLSPSPLFKEILGKVDEQRLAGTLTHRDAALAWVRAYLGKAEKGASC